MKTFHFTFGLWGLLTSSTVQPTPQKPSSGMEGGLKRVTEFIRVMSEGDFDRARLMLTPDFKAHEPALNKISTADEMIYTWDLDRQLIAQRRFEIKKTALFGVFGDIDQDKYVYIRADCHILRFCSNQQKTIPFEMIARIEDNRIAHLLFCFGINKAFEKLSSVQHARSLAHAS
jgi:hypothetical protein